MVQLRRSLETPLRSRTSRGRARLVLGARQTGKSTLFRRLATSRDLLVDLQDRQERLRLAADPGALGRALLPARGHRHVLIDEVQRVPALLDEVQLLLDRHPGRFTFTLTGSSARRLRRGPVNLLPGRIHLFELWPVSRWETDGAPRATVLAAPKGLGPAAFPARELEDLLLTGSLPAACLEPPASFRRTLESYAAVYVEEEVLREMAARSLGDYGRFLEMAALEAGKPINLTRVSQETGIALSTLRGFYSVLEDTLIGFTVPPFAGSGRSRLVKTPRFYFFDLGVRNALARMPLDRLPAGDRGALFEHWVACELRARIGYLGRGHRLSFWRTSDGAEVDFVLETPRGVVPIEVKHTANPRPADARGLEHFLARHPGLARRGYLVCRALRREQLTERVQAVPWQEL